MGILNLLKMVQPSMTAFNMSDFVGTRCVIDGYSRLYQAISRCATKLLADPDSACSAYIAHSMTLIDLLQKHQIEVTVFFDGRMLPSKMDVQMSRRSNRAEALAKAREALASGDRDLAHSLFTRAISVTPRIVSNICRVFQRNGVKCIVAPYEADAQLAAWVLTGKADWIITEDADLILLGCPRICFKMNQNGQGDLYDRDRALDHLQCSASELRAACIMAGCDYFKGIDGVGVITALKKLDARDDFVTWMRKLHSYKNEKMSFIDVFKAIIKAELTFLHQVVYDPSIHRCTRLSNLFRVESFIINIQTLKKYLFEIDAIADGDELMLQYSERDYSDLEVDDYFSHYFDNISFAGVIPFASSPQMERNICEHCVADFNDGQIHCRQDFLLYGIESQKPSEADILAANKLVDEQVWYRDAASYQPEYFGPGGLSTSQAALQHKAEGKLQHLKESRENGRQQHGGASSSIPLLSALDQLHDDFWSELEDSAIQMSRQRKNKKRKEAPPGNSYLERFMQRSRPK